MWITYRHDRVIIARKERLEHSELRRTRILILIEEYEFELLTLTLTNLWESSRDFGTKSHDVIEGVEVALCLLSFNRFYQWK